MIAVKYGHVEHSVQHDPLRCNDRGLSFANLFDCLIYVKRVCSTFMCHPVEEIVINCNMNYFDFNKLPEKSN